jgi:hypothetical protein
VIWHRFTSQDTLEKVGRPWAMRVALVAGD